MATTGTNIIHRQVFDIAINGTEADGLALQRRIGPVVSDWLVPAIGRALERVDPGDEHWIIDRLDIDAGVFAVGKLEDALPTAVAAALESLLSARAGTPPGRYKPSSATEPGRRRQSGSRFDAMALQPFQADDTLRSEPDGMVRRSRSETVAEAFMHFLATGLLPWWYRLPESASLADEAGSLLKGTDASIFVRRLTERALPEIQAMRLARQFPIAFHKLLLPMISSAASAAATALWARLDGSAMAAGVAQGQGDPLAKTTLEVAVWRTFIRLSVAGGSTESPAIAAMVREELAATPGKAPEVATRLLVRVSGIRPQRPGPSPKPPVNLAGRSDPDEGGTKILSETQPVDCAGIVLLHPFLPQLFGSLGIADEARILAPGRALGLLHFLATGQASAPEHALLLPKLLCGLEPDALAPAPLPLDEADREEALALLKAVIGHWSTLGGASVDSLRGTFLVRPGLLRRRADGDDLLQVEQQSFDILLDGIPWGFSAIRLHWMRRMLWVEWSH